MSGLNRRQFLALAGSVGAAQVATAADPQAALPTFDNAFAILYDATRCIGCRACARRCREVNKLPPDEGLVDGVAFDKPHKLSHINLMVIQAFQAPAGPGAAPRPWSFLKRNCMHCNVPACASACPVAALRKTDKGPVLYFEDRCIGCRYCMLACPYEVPRYEWFDRMPRVRKCNLNGGCVKACPVAALVAGTRKQLISEARHRIEREPGRYIDHVYGEFEGGGTSYLILSAIPLEKLGMPKLPPTNPASFAEPILGAVPGWVVGLALFLGALRRLQARQEAAAADAPSAPGSGAGREGVS
ncbi:Formate dehydrogenase, nitrate-inducible, iron-sulfur subunit [Phycisphaerae bacterium RAS1]|nr:Formate dehydrogenase, nitrate-inducible, iron-sulfur subunit [Phycisphaerae bacterium RAS1]